MVYRIGNPFVKSDWYDVFTGKLGERNLISMTDPYQHGQLRRLAAQHFSKKWIFKLEPYISKNVKLAIAGMFGEDKRNGHFDIFKWFTFMATDVIGEASFGESFRTLETGEKNVYIKDLEQVGSRLTVRSELPWIIRIGKYFPVGPAKEVPRAVGRLNGYAEESIQRYWKGLETDPDNVKPTLLSEEYSAVETGTISAAQLRRDALGYIIAGTDTTAVTATYAVWLLSCHPEIERDLIHEVSILRDGFTDDDLQPLRHLNNVINETLRLRGPITQGLPRLVPPESLESCGHLIPPGTVVGVQAYTMHRNPEVWGHPEAFNPARWSSRYSLEQDIFTVGY